jgi:class 3 adenylate cyclase
MPQEPGRRVVTVLFLDLVGSTAIASDLGDHRWRHLLSTFLRTVRSQLKHFGGHEEDTTGDGLFATFQAPDNAIRCAEAIATSVHEFGLEVRCGLHAGGVETIDGKLGGIAVHIGARVMSLGGPAEVLVTSTGVREEAPRDGQCLTPVCPRKRVKTRCGMEEGRAMTWRDTTIAGYLVSVLAGLVLELMATRSVGRIPSLSTVFARVMRTRAGGFGVLATWAWVGMHFFAR